MRSFIGGVIVIFIAIIIGTLSVMFLAPEGFERIFGVKALTAQYQQLDAPETTVGPEPIILTPVPEKELVIASEEPLASAMVQLDDSECTFNAGVAASIVNCDDYSFAQGEIFINKLGDGHILKSGEVFSYNETVGERTSSKGFVMSSIPEKQADGSYKQVPSMGAGVCRLSVCLAWVADNAGLEIVQREPHLIAPIYLNNAMNPGILKHDATVYWPDTDNKFKNIKPYDIKIHTWLDRDNNIIHADMYRIVYE